MPDAIHSTTLVLQSFRQSAVPSWIQACIQSVRRWAEHESYAYHCAGDQEILATLPSSFRDKVGDRWPMLSDLGRLKLAQNALRDGYERVIWLDADVVVFRPQSMKVPAGIKHGYAFGREYWVDDSERIRKGVHNAICVFERGNPFLDFYAYACERIIAVHSGQHLAPQLLGPKFLKMQHSLLGFELLDGVGMLSPKVITGLLENDDRLFSRQERETECAPAAYNLCHSLIDAKQAQWVVDWLLD